MAANKPVNILLVDDRPDGLLTMEAVLDSSDYVLYKACSGQEALSYLTDHEFAVILLDVQMPDMDGFETAALIKQNANWKDIPIIFVTAIHQDISYIYKGYRVGAVDYIFKPFDPYVLRSKVAVFAELYRKNIRIQQSQEELRRKEEELHQARKLEAIGRLAGGVAHDFNNLVTGILGISQELQESFSPDDPRRTDIEEVIKASQRAFSLIRQLLSYARRQVISPQFLDLNAVVTDMQEMLVRLIGEDVQLMTQLDSDLGGIYADQSYLEQVIINLVLNARDAMRAQGGTVTIKTSNVELTEHTIPQPLQLKEGSYVLLSVADTGRGMTTEVLGHIFEPFFSTKEKDQGTGLGLATVYGIVKQNGGDIGVHSQVDQGTVMEIYLPRAIEQQKGALLSDNNLVIPRGRETIMVVEDEEIVRRVVTNLLKKKGYTILEACNGREAISCSQKHKDRIDLLLTDIIMPEINGRELAGAITSEHPETIVLYMSGYTQDVIAHRGILDSGIHFIEKSSIASELDRKVHELLSGRRTLSTPSSKS